MKVWVLQPGGRWPRPSRLNKLRFPGHTQALGPGTRHPVPSPPDPCMQPAWPGVGRTEERLEGDSGSPSPLDRTASTRPPGPTPSLL